MSDKYIWDLRPFEGLGDLRLGMSRQEVHNILGEHYETFKRSEFASNDTEAYDNFGVYLDYDEDGGLEFIEASDPCIPKFMDIKITGRVDSVVRELKEHGYIVDYEDPSYFYRNLGFALYAPGDSIEAVSVFGEDYYD